MAPQVRMMTPLPVSRDRIASSTASSRTWGKIPDTISKSPNKKHERPAASVPPERDTIPSTVTGKIKCVQALLNDRTRKLLNWHSPAHAFHQLLR